MKRLILLCILLHSFQPTYSETDVTEQSHPVTLKHVLVGAAVIVVPYVLVKLHTWWQKRTLFKLGDTELSMALQQRINDCYGPFEPACTLLSQRESSTSDEEWNTLTNQIKTHITAYDDMTQYKFSTYADAVHGAMGYIHVHQQWIEEHMNNMARTTDAQQRFIALRDMAYTTHNKLTQLYNFVTDLDEFTHDVVDKLQESD